MYRYIILILFINSLQSVKGLNELCANNCPDYLKYCPNNCNDNLWTCSSSNQCIHKDLFPINYLDIILGISVIITTGLSSIGGIGGGGLLLPIYILLGSFGIDYSIPITIITVAGTTFMKFLLLFSKKHNLSFKRNMIDYLLVLIIVPFDSNFSFLGYILNVTSPLWFLTINIFLILSIMTIKMIKKGYELYILETEKKDILYIDGIPLQELAKSSIYIDGIQVDINSEDYKIAVNEHSGDDDCDKYLYLFYVILTFSFLAIFSIIRNYFIKVCSVEYWSYLTGQILLTTLIGIFIIYKVININKDRISNNYHFLESDIEYTNFNLFKIVSIATITGILSTFLGIGGGMIMTPILNSLGMLPEVVSATSSVTTFFSAIISTIQYIGSDIILPYYSIYFFIIGSIGGLIGTKFTKFIVEFLNNRYLVLVILSFLIGSSCLLLTGINVNKLVNDDNDNKFSNLCK